MIPEKSLSNPEISPAEPLTMGKREHKSSDLCKVGGRGEVGVSKMRRAKVRRETITSQKYSSESVIDMSLYSAKAYMLQEKKDS